jgi:hypothetical protein
MPVRIAATVAYFCVENGDIFVQIGAMYPAGNTRMTSQ